MSAGKPEGSLRTDLAYDAGASMAFPALLDIPGVERVASPVESRIDAVYFDTANLDLTARRITLQRLTGGTNHGWLLHIPGGTAPRQEFDAPLGQPDAVSRELLTHVLAYTRGKDLSPIACLATRRNTYRLYGPGGEHLADFADDRIHAGVVHAAGPGEERREWKVLLVHGDTSLLAAAEDTLGATGVGRSRRGDELARALGAVFPPERATGIARPRKKGRKIRAIDVVSDYLDAHINELLTKDAGVRLGQPHAVHQMRSATRRIRSTLSTYADLYAKGTARGLGVELKWFARLLGRPRDGEVMRKRLRQHISNLPKPLQAGTVSESLERELGTAYNVDYRELLKALESDRYYRLLEDLEQFRDHPPTKARASRPARSETAKAVNRTAKLLDRAHKSVARAKAGDARDTALHQVRKDAKRLLHAADSVAAIHGKRARRISRRAHRLQKVLGNHHDSVMVRALLDDLATDPALPEEAVRGYRRILKIERGIARDAVKKYPKARKKASGLRLPR